MLTHSATVLILGILLFVAGIFLQYFVGRNRFNRRGVAGQQQYGSFARGLATTFFESMLRLLGKLMIVAGIFLALLYGYNKHTAEKHRAEQLKEKRQ